MLKIGVLRETKSTPDRRVAIPPQKVNKLLNSFKGKIELYIQPSDIRCYKDEEYQTLGLTLKEDLSDCDILIGIKEVKISTLISDKKYIFFSHTAKKQLYNRPLLKEALKKKIQLIDYEYLTDKNNSRLVAFGKWAGIVGAYNGLIGFGIRNNLYKTKRACDCFDMQEVLQEVRKIKLPAIKILITGGGRVAHGALETLAPLKLKEVNAQDFISKTYNEPVLCRLDPKDYVQHKNGKDFSLQHFFDHPKEYESTFLPFTKVTDILIPCHFWDQNSPKFMTKADVQAKDFSIQVIADVSCDIDGPIPSTIRPSTIAEPFYGYNAKTGKEGDAFDKKNITVMAIDNLPGELPRDASVEFFNGLLQHIFPSLIDEDSEGIIKRASITKDGMLTDDFSYLQEYLDN